MAILTEMQVAEIKSHMATSEDLLLKKFKAKNSKTENTTVPIAEREAYESIGFSAVAVLKKKVKMSRPKDAGREFEDDIWCMFYKLGFRTLNSDENLTIQWGDNPSDKHQLDVVAIGDDAIFVVECKAAETLKTRQFKDDINIICQYKDGVTKALRQIYGTDKKVRFIFATRKYRIQEEGEDAIRMKDNQIFHLNDNTYEYINNLIISYKSSVIYQFYGLMFKDQLINNDRITIPALQGTMGGQKYYLFSIEPNTLLKIGFVLHRTRVNDSMAPTYQRLLVPSRLKGITKFIDEGGYFPNSIIINFAAVSKKMQVSFEAASKLSNSRAKYGVLSIPNAYGIAYIIDGQHRVYGYAASKFKDTNTIPVVAFENMPSEEQLKIFMDINENQKAVKPSLRLDLEEDLYWNAGRLDSRMKALRSSIIKNLAGDINNILYNKISIGEDGAELAFKPFDNAFSKSGLIPSATQTHWSGDTDIYIYDTDETDSDKAMKDSRKRITQFVNGVYYFMDETLNEERKNDYLFSNRATFAIITLIGSLHKYLIKLEIINKNSPIKERLSAIKPYIYALTEAINNISEEDNASLKGYLGQGADTFWLRMFQNMVNRKFPDYEPEELVLFKETQDETIQKEGRELKIEIKEFLKKSVFIALEQTYGNNWENSLAVASIKNDCTARMIKDLEGNEAESLDNYDWKDYLETTDYKQIINKNFQSEYINPRFAIDLGDGFKTKTEKLAWLAKIDSPKGKKHDALTRNDINKLWLIRDHLANSVE